MKLFQSLWVLTDNDAMDVTQIEATTPAEPSEPVFTQQNIQQEIAAECDYPKNIINLLDYIKLKEHAY